jgi:hypothetical protein
MLFADAAVVAGTKALPRTLAPTANRALLLNMVDSSVLLHIVTLGMASTYPDIRVLVAHEECP